MLCIICVHGVCIYIDCGATERAFHDFNLTYCIHVLLDNVLTSVFFSEGKGPYTLFITGQQT